MNPVLDVRGLRKSYGGTVLFDGVDLAVAEGEKVGVIGRNGTGKSTLFRILAGEEGLDEGTVALRRGLRVGYLPQDPPVDPARSVFETVGEGTGELGATLARYEAVNDELAATPSPEAMETLLEEQAELSARIERLDGWDWRHRVETLLTRLGIDGWERPMGALSGGERRRVALARTLLSEPDLLLLDEPTNHLDAETVLWLEETLFDVPAAALLITHDRYFLDRVVDRMIEVTPLGLTEYEGGYTEYLEERTRREERLAVEERKRTKLLEKELAWARRAPPARTGKQKARRARAGEMAEAQRRRDRTRVRDVEMEMHEAPRLGRTVLEAQGIAKSLGGERLFEGFSEKLLAGERLGIVGPNGCGKTTLLRTLLGEIEPDEGEVVHGENTRIGYFDQARRVDLEQSVARVVSDSDWVELGDRKMHLRAYLDRFLFPSHMQDQPVRVLSGGERNRVLLAKLFLEEFNLLVLDEPTNDLDLDTLRILEDLIEEFAGCVLLVTHDRYLLDKVATSLLVFEGEGRIYRHHGGWDSYLERREALLEERQERVRARERERKAQRAEAARTEARDARSDRPKLTFREQRELEGMEARLAEIETEKEALGARLADPEFYQGEADEISRVTKRYEELEATVEGLYERWMELEEKR